MERQEFIKNFPQMEAFYVIYSKLTRLPYIVCNPETYDDEATLYSDQVMAEEAARSLEVQERPTYVVKVENKDFLRAFSEFYSYGINVLQFFTEEDQYTLQINEVVKQKTYEDMPEEKRPLNNASLQISMIYYMQELRREKGKPDPEKYRDMEEEMVHNLINAKFYLPYRDVEVDGQTRQQLSFLKMKTGGTMVPIFTDPIEFTKFLNAAPNLFPNKEAKASILTYEKLLTIPTPEGTMGYMINPSGISLPLPMQYAKQIYENNKPGADEES